MAKRKITVTVDVGLVEEAQLLGIENLSAVVNEALAAHVDRLARRAALRQLLDDWDRELGPVSEAALADARAAFDEVDGDGRGPGRSVIMPVVLDLAGLDKRPAIAGRPTRCGRCCTRRGLVDERSSCRRWSAPRSAGACPGPGGWKAALARARPPFSVVDTDFALARQVGAVLHGSAAGSGDMVDAHVVAVCALHDGGVVVTVDADDIERLAHSVPAVRIVTRPAR